MFSYYGSKSTVVSHYPPPKYKLIIEPFAGSAQYACRFGLGKDVWLNDSYDVIYKTWEYILKVSAEEIKRLPDIKRGDDIRNLGLTDAQRYLLGWCCSIGVDSPRNIVTTYADKTAFPKDDSRWRPHTAWQLTRERILKNIPLIKKWIITNLDYRDMLVHSPDVEATWFIDPPYQNGGKYYKKNEIDYVSLAEWCKTRKGQVIVCENTKGTWLDFKPLVEMRGQRYKTTEAMWYKENF